MTHTEAYWMAFAHLPRWGNAKRYSLIERIYDQQKISMDEFFIVTEEEWKGVFKLDDKQVSDLNRAKEDLNSNNELAEKLKKSAVEVIPVVSAEYPAALIENLKIANAPTVVYIKGNKLLLQQSAISIMGSRVVSSIGLDFTEEIVEQFVKEQKIIVTAFAKGIDKHALDCTLKFGGKCIIVLSQGILTFTSISKALQKQIDEGNVLLLSIFFPNADWKAELTMAKQPVVHALGEKVFIPEASEKGGTVKGVLEALKKGKQIYVRKPDAGEQNANQLLIDKGAIGI